jgi:hypothetical protein
MNSTHDISMPATEVVIMAPSDPSEEILNLVFSPFFQGKVHYIYGSPLVEEDLFRAGIETADACFILTRKSLSSLKPNKGTAWSPIAAQDTQDSHNVLLTLMVENFNPSVDTFVEIHGLKHR